MVATTFVLLFQMLTANVNYLDVLFLRHLCKVQQDIQETYSKSLHIESECSGLWVLLDFSGTTALLVI